MIPLPRPDDEEVLRRQSLFRARGPDRTRAAMPNNSYISPFFLSGSPRLAPTRIQKGKEKGKMATNLSKSPIPCLLLLDRSVRIQKAQQ
jgi:hypothetical protein